ncbi:MAG: BtpA/SgcQ family protein [Acidimicrobiia bacterium]
MVGVLPNKPNALGEIFREPKPVIGVIHLPPLPGAPRYDGEPMKAIYETGVRDALTLAEGGVDGIIVENAFDLPFARPDQIGPETVAALATACAAVTQAVDVPIGITCVANGAIPALAIAKAVGARWVRVNQWANAYVANEGLLNGAASEALRYRSFIQGKDIKILADVHVKFGSHAITSDRSIAEQARDAEFFDADVLIASGQRTGSPTEPEEVEAIRDGTTLPILIGSGFNAETASDLLAVADGAIVGSWLKEDGEWWRPVDPERVRVLMTKVEEIRREAIQNQKENQ